MHLIWEDPGVANLPKSRKVTVNIFPTVRHRNALQHVIADVLGNPAQQCIRLRIELFQKISDHKTPSITPPPASPSPPAPAPPQYSPAHPAKTAQSARAADR